MAGGLITYYDEAKAVVDAKDVQNNDKAQIISGLIIAAAVLDLRAHGFPAVDVALTDAVHAHLDVACQTMLEAGVHAASRPPTPSQARRKE